MTLEKSPACMSPKERQEFLKYNFDRAMRIFRYCAEVSKKQSKTKTFFSREFLITTRRQAAKLTSQELANWLVEHMFTSIRQRINQLSQFGLIYFDQLTTVINEHGSIVNNKEGIPLKWALNYQIFSDVLLDHYSAFAEDVLRHLSEYVEKFGTDNFGDEDYEAAVARGYALELDVIGELFSLCRSS